MNRACSYSALALFALFVVAASACVGSDPSPAGVGGTDTTDAGGSADSAQTGPGYDGSGADGGGDATTCTSGTLCGSTCVNTATSADHCGACGHSCGGGTCDASHCKPVLVASNVAQPLGVAVAGGSAFWIRNGAVERCAVTGCTGSPALITDQVAVGAGQPGGTTIVTDGNQVAWIANGNASGNGRDVLQCGVAGCLNGYAPKPSTGMTGTPTQLALAGAILFATQDVGAERQGPISTLVLSGAGIGSDVPTGIAADATYLYVAGVSQSAAGVDRCTRVAGSTCTDPARLFVGAVYIAAGGGSVYATSTDGIKACASTGCGGSAAVLVPEDKAAAAIAANDAFVAWVNPGSTNTGDGSVRVCASPNCTGGPRTIADAQDHPVSVTIADGFVYWSNKGVSAGTGSIWRAAL